MNEDSARSWIKQTIRSERYALERARRRFIRKPTEEHLHDVRTRGRRLHSLLEDVDDIASRPKLRKRVKRAAEVTDTARNATVLCQLLETCADESERAAIEQVLADLRRQERVATRDARKQLRRLRVWP